MVPTLSRYSDLSDTNMQTDTLKTVPAFAVMVGKKMTSQLCLIRLDQRQALNELCDQNERQIT